MDLDKLVEEKIREAMQAGEFDNLASRGKPIDLRPYFDTPEDLRLAYSVLKNAGIVPGEVELLREIGAIRFDLASSSSDENAGELRKRLEEKVLKLNLILERRKIRPAR